MVEETGALGYQRAFIDHPFSEVFELDVAAMKRWASARPIDTAWESPNPESP